jgi:hypothetical protein
MKNNQYEGQYAATESDLIPLLVLDFGLDVVDGVGRLHL